MNNGLLLALITAAGFGAWPIIGRATGANQFWMVTLVMVPTIAITSWTFANGLAVLPPARTSLVLVAAGIMNGISMIAASKIILGRHFEISSLFVIVNVTIVTMSALGGILLFKEAVTPSKCIGLACAVAAAWLLSC